jgi:hypothetical protein
MISTCWPRAAKNSRAALTYLVAIRIRRAVVSAPGRPATIMRQRAIFRSRGSYSPPRHAPSAHPCRRLRGRPRPTGHRSGRRSPGSSPTSLPVGWCRGSACGWCQDRRGARCRRRAAVAACLLKMRPFDRAMVSGVSALGVMRGVLSPGHGGSARRDRRTCPRCSDSRGRRGRCGRRRSRRRPPGRPAPGWPRRAGRSP